MGSVGCAASSPIESASEHVLDPLAPPADGSSWRVVTFITTDCPIANSYAPEMGRLRSEFEPRGVTFYFGHVHPDTGKAAALEHARAHDLPWERIFIDRDQELARRFGIRVTPETVLLRWHAPEGGADSGSWRVIYQGRIDDRYRDFGERSFAPGRRDLALALDAALRGEAPPLARTDAVGCPIPARAR